MGKMSALTTIDEFVSWRGRKLTCRIGKYAHPLSSTHLDA